MNKIASGIMMILFLIGSLSLVFNIRPVKATGTIYIMADGSINPPTAPIATSDYITYTFTAPIYDSIVVLRRNIIVDGKGYTLQGSGTGFGFSVSSPVYNVTIKNTCIETFDYGISFYSASWNNVYGNTIIGNNIGVCLSESARYNVISGNNITSNYYGVELYGLDTPTSYNAISKNSIAYSYYDGIFLYGSTYCSISDNRIAYNGRGIETYVCHDIAISGNSIVDNIEGIAITSQLDQIYHNNFVNNVHQAYSAYMDSWDYGYPSGGNYWSDYTTMYPSAQEIDNSHIWNTPYVINGAGQDNYPLMGPWTSNGENISVTPAPGVDLTFASVTSAGITTVNKTQSGPTPIAGYKIEGPYCNIETTATFSGTVAVRMAYDDSSMMQQEENSLLLMRWSEETQQWEDITTHVDMENNVIYGETNHLSVFGVHSQLIHDLSVFGVHVEKTIVGQGYAISVDVLVRNVGDFAEDFDVTVDLVSGQINYFSIFGVHMESGSSGAVTLTCDTTTLARATYSVRAHVSHVAYEVHTADNDYTDGEIKVTIPGDVDGDFFVNIMDATQIGYYWLQGVPPAPPEVDITGDGIINILDATIVGLNWLQHA